MIAGHYKNLWAKLREKIVEIIEILTKKASLELTGGAGCG